MIILPRKGILVSDLNPRHQLLVLEVRRELERLLSRAGAERATKEQREQFHDIARGMDRAAKTNDDIAFMRLDREFNRLVVDAAHNDYAARSMKLLQGLSRRFWYMHYRQAADLPLCARLHANQARSIAQGDGEAAARASDKLIDYVESFTRGTVRCERHEHHENLRGQAHHRWPGRDGRRPDRCRSITRSSGSPSAASSGPTMERARNSWRWRSCSTISATRSAPSRFRSHT